MGQVHKILFAGPVGSGKTTAIRALSDIEVVGTEAVASDRVATLKPTTTVALDYGMMKLANGDRVDLYGAPGQRRFDFMWDILTEHALGLVLLVDGQARDPVADLREYVGAFRGLIDRSAVAVGLTHADQAPWQLRQHLCAELQALALPPCALSVDARQRSHMAMLVKTLLFALDPFTGAEQQDAGGLRRA